MSVQFIQTPNGDEMAVLSRKEYEALIRAVNQRERREEYERLSRSSLTEPQKAEIMSLMDRGDSLLRATRKWRRFTQMYVEHFRTTLSSVSQSYLTDLETGKRSGSREVLINLAKIYNVPEDLFVDQV
jgi:hypothetical protein